MEKLLVKKVASSILLLSLIASMSSTAFAKEDLTVDIGNNITVNVDQIAKENGVDPYALKDAIEKGLDSEKASPFSDLYVEESFQSVESDSMDYADYNVSLDANKVSKNNQDSTAYVSSATALTASGKTPSIGMCAMHQDVTTKTGNTTSTCVKLGTTIYMTNSININGKNYSSFVVEDRGKPKNRTTYWIDLYFGLKDQHYNDAINYGVQKVSYYYYR